MHNDAVMHTIFTYTTIEKFVFCACTHITKNQIHLVQSGCEIFLKSFNIQRLREGCTPDSCKGWHACTQRKGFDSSGRYSVTTGLYLFTQLILKGRTPVPWTANRLYSIVAYQCGVYMEKLMAKEKCHHLNFDWFSVSLTFTMLFMLGWFSLFFSSQKNEGLIYSIMVGHCGTKWGRGIILLGQYPHVPAEVMEETSKGTQLKEEAKKESDRNRGKTRKVRFPLTDCLRGLKLIFPLDQVTTPVTWLIWPGAYIPFIKALRLEIHRLVAFALDRSRIAIPAIPLGNTRGRKVGRSRFSFCATTKRTCFVLPPLPASSGSCFANHLLHHVWFLTMATFTWEF